MPAAVHQGVMTRMVSRTEQEQRAAQHDATQDPGTRARQITPPLSPMRQTALTGIEECFGPAHYRRRRACNPMGRSSVHVSLSSCRAPSLTSSSAAARSGPAPAAGVPAAKKM